MEAGNFLYRTKKRPCLQDSLSLKVLEVYGMQMLTVYFFGELLCNLFNLSFFHSQFQNAVTVSDLISADDTVIKELAVNPYIGWIDRSANTAQQIFTVFFGWSFLGDLFRDLIL
jgi:hypothetical protein